MHTADWRAVVVDVVEQWCGLSARLRSAYAACESPFSAIARFTWEYIDRVEAGEPTDQAGDYDATQWEVWQHHVARLRDAPTLSP